MPTCNRVAKLFILFFSEFAGVININVFLFCQNSASDCHIYIIHLAATGFHLRNFRYSSTVVWNTFGGESFIFSYRLIFFLFKFFSGVHYAFYCFFSLCNADLSTFAAVYYNLWILFMSCTFRLQLAITRFCIYDLCLGHNFVSAEFTPVC